MARMNSFKYIEYSGDDAADVLVSLLMNLAHPELASGGGPDEVDTMSQTEIPASKPVALGFQPNESDDDEEEDEDE